MITNDSAAIHALRGMGGGRGEGRGEGRGGEGGGGEGKEGRRGGDINQQSKGESVSKPESIER